MESEFRKLISYVRALFPIAVAAVGISLYALTIPTAPVGKALLDVGWFARLDYFGLLLGGEPGDFASCALTYLATTLFLFLIPLGAFKIAFPQYRLIDLGFRAPKNGLRSWKNFFLAWLIVIVIGGLGVFDETYLDFYPLTKTLTIVDPGLIKFLIHSVLYIIFFYIPWEFFFRGLLIFPMLKLVLNDSPKIEPRSMVLASLQTVPSALLHFGHPIMESLGAIALGILGAYMALRFRSIWPAVIIHATLGLSLDAMFTLQAVLR